MPSLAQQLNRANTGHRMVLAAVAEDRKVTTPATPLAQVKGYATCMATLVRWGCITSDRLGSGRYEVAITPAGRELLGALEARTSNGLDVRRNVT